MTSEECELNSRGDECLPFLQMGQHCSGSYTGLTHSGTAQSDTTQCTSLFGSQRHHSQGDGCGQGVGEKNSESRLDDSVGFTFVRVCVLCMTYCSSVEGIVCCYMHICWYFPIKKYLYYMHLTLSWQTHKWINYSKSQQTEPVADF